MDSTLEQIFDPRIKLFLHEAKQHGYAAGSNPGIYHHPDGSVTEVRKETDGSTTIIHVDRNWQCHDNYFGGEPYGGREVVSVEGRPVWMMAYYGLVLDNIDPKKVYPFLQEALRAASFDDCFRGPCFHQNDKWTYINDCGGDIPRFEGTELIYYQGKLVYEASYLGGLVDQRRN